MSESWWKRQSKQNVKRLAELRVQDKVRDEVNERGSDWAETYDIFTALYREARAAAVDVRR